MYRPALCFALVVLPLTGTLLRVDSGGVIVESSAPAPTAQPAVAGIADHPAVKVARGYLGACEHADTAALNALFLDQGRATVSDNASDEGTWETYRDHHLLPELREAPGFKMSVRKEDLQDFGATSVVRQIGSFTVPDPNHPDAPRSYLAAVTYVVVESGGLHKIADLHWSSRAERRPDAKDGSSKTDAIDTRDHK